MSNEIRVPTLGESVSEATIGRWHKKTGDAVRKDEPIVELETDKVTLDVPAPATGVLAETIIMEGETAAVGALLGTIAEGEASGASPETAAQAVVAAVETNESSKGGSMIEVVAPSAGESVTEADIGSLYVKVGDVVNADDALFELETDKAALEVVAPVSGKIAEILHEEGATIAPGDVVLLMEEGAAGDVPATSAPAPAAAAPAPAAKGTDMPPAPSAAKMMAENNVDAGSVAGSGKRGQVLKGDVMDAMASGTSSAAPAAAAPRGPVSADDEVREERVKMTRLRQTIARRLKDAQNTAAMLTTYNLSLIHISEPTRPY